MGYLTSWMDNDGIEAGNNDVLSPDLENLGQVHLYKSCWISAIIQTILLNFHRNDGNMAGNKNIISDDFDNVGHGHCLEKSLYF